jgi:hypothetical protein
MGICAMKLSMLEIGERQDTAKNKRQYRDRC